MASGIKSRTVSSVPDNTRNDTSSSASSPSLSLQSVSLNPFESVIPFVCGCAFGLLLHLGRVDEFIVIRRQFTFSSFIMLKMFLSAASASLLSLALLSRWSPSLSSSLSSASFRSRGLVFTCLGSFLLGIGMQFSGSCPGTVYAQLGAGSSRAIFVWLGGAVGALAYGFMQILFPPRDSADTTNTRGGQPDRLIWKEAEKWGIGSQLQGLHTLLGVSRNTVVLGLAGAFLSVVLAAELYRPWKQDLALALPSSKFGDRDGVAHYALPAPLAGLLIGSLQLVLFSVAAALLGTSSSYSAIVHPVLRLFVSESDFRSSHSPIASLKLSDLKQVLFVFGVTVGGWLGASVFQISFASDSAITVSEALVGGFLLVFGARMANGCTSGQGITGIGLLSTGALMAVACMFAGAIGTAIFR